MLDALTEDGLFSPATHQAILPMMTALFVDGLGSKEVWSEPPIDWFGSEISTKRARIFRLPVETGFQFPNGRNISATGNISRSLKKSSGGQASRLRPLIQGISHHFNNLLMGIWGNATLIRLQLEPADPLYTQATQLEYLVQSGAHLIHLVLGYLGERRTVAKRLRLNQLITQMRSEISESHDIDTGIDFERLLKWASRVQRPRIVASSTARVLDLLFRSIQSQCFTMRAGKGHNSQIDRKIDTICDLLRRGLDITDQLRLYSADFRTRKRKTRIASLIKRLVKRHDPSSSIDIQWHISPDLPLVQIDCKLLEGVFNHLYSNAAAAMPQGGQLDISARTLQQELPGNRCGVQKGSDYLVISFKDSGRGMNAKIQKRIFDPFFTYPQKQGTGLGLPAAAGIIKAHNGYIQVRSKENAGSTVSIYLPIAGAAVQGQRLKEKI